jgi:hypothetical protein
MSLNNILTIKPSRHERELVNGGQKEFITINLNKNFRFNLIQVRNLLKVSSEIYAL